MGMEYTVHIPGPWNGNGIYWVLDYYNVNVRHTALAGVCVKVFILPSKLFQPKGLFARSTLRGRQLTYFGLQPNALAAAIIEFLSFNTGSS